jgi:hypothetical protein
MSICTSEPILTLVRTPCAFLGQVRVLRNRFKLKGRLEIENALCFNVRLGDATKSDQRRGHQCMRKC